MALFTRSEIVAALTRLGEFALEADEHVRLFAVGGAVMVLRHGTRPATKDLDVVILAPEPASAVRALAARVADDLGLPSDWLNDGAKGFVGAAVDGEPLFSAPGITVTGASAAQQLALKLMAWRDDVDIADAEVCLRVLGGTRDEARAAVETFLAPGYEQKAGYALEELWEVVYGSD